MPWASVATAFGTISIAGTEGDGKITLAIGLAMVLLRCWSSPGTCWSSVCPLVS